MKQVKAGLLEGVHMKKTTNLPDQSFWKKAAVSTVCQYLFFKAVFAGYLQLYIVSHSYRATVWGGVILCFAIPVVGGADIAGSGIGGPSGSGPGR